MSDLRKVQLSQILMSSQFWMATIVLYFTSLRNLSLSEVYTVISLFSIAVVFLEYPTGVLGDRFSHRTSVLFGYFLCSVSMLFLSFSGSLFFYCAILLLYATGTSLISGSDTALLHHVSQNFLSDSSNTRIFSLFMSFFSISLGGYFASFDLRIPFYLTSFCSLLSAILIFFTKKQPLDTFKGNIFQRSFQGMLFIKRKNILFHTILVSGVISSFFFSFKWFYNPLFLQMDIPVSLWGVIMGFTTLCMALGIYVHKKFSQKKILPIFFFLIITLFCIGFTQWKYLVLCALFLAFSLRGFFENSFSISLVENAGTKFKASVLSFQSMIIRLLSSLTIFLSGIALEKVSFFTLMTILSCIILIFCFFSIVQFQKIKT